MTISTTKTTTNSTRALAVTVLKNGSKGEGVVELQTLLRAAGVPTGPIDGDFGPLTTAAVRRFQASRGLAVDGEVGPMTLAALRAARTSAVDSTQAPLRMGDLGGEVVKAQQLLAKHGYVVQVDGQFGPQTRAAVVQFQRARGLLGDGSVGPATWQALHGPVGPRPSHPVTPPPSQTPGPLGARMLDVARAELGYVERTGHNDGEILKYPHAFGRGSEAWCADFVSWVSQRAGGRMNDPYTPSIVSSLKRDGHWKGRSNPQVGDLVLFDFDGDGTPEHIGLVEKVNHDGTISTIEGNTVDPRSGRQGVFRRERSVSLVLGYGTPY